MAIPVQCPGCRRQHEAGDDLAGKACRCSCGATLKIPIAQPIASPVRPVNNDVIVCACPGCGRRHQVGPALHGKRAKCTCGLIMVVPARRAAIHPVGAPASSDPFGNLGDLSSWEQAAPTQQRAFQQPAVNAYASPAPIRKSSGRDPAADVQIDPQTRAKTPVIHCGGCGYQGRQLAAHQGYHWWHLPLGILLLCSGAGVIPLTIAMIAIANYKKPTCPQCRRTDALHPSGGVPGFEADRVWERAYRQDAAAFKTQKLTILAVVMVLLVLAIAFAAVVVASNGKL